MSRCVPVIIIDDKTIEINEELTVSLSAVPNGVEIIPKSVPIIISDDDGKLIYVWVIVQ